MYTIVTMNRRYQGSVWAAVGTSFSIKNPLATDNLGDVVTLITQGIRELSIPVAVVMIVWAGFLFLTGGNNPNNITKARSILTWTTVGLAIIFIGSGFIDLLKSILNPGV